MVHGTHIGAYSKRAIQACGCICRDAGRQSPGLVTQSARRTEQKDRKIVRVCVRERERGGETSTAGTKRLCNAQSLPVIAGGLRVPTTRQSLLKRCVETKTRSERGSRLRTGRHASYRTKRSDLKWRNPSPFIADSLTVVAEPQIRKEDV